jgi:hypothetical protein
MRHAAGGHGVPETFEPTQELLAQYRSDLVRAWIALASENLSPARRAWLYEHIDCREWLIRLIAKDFSEQLEKVDRELEAALRR